MIFLTPHNPKDAFFVTPKVCSCRTIYSTDRLRRSWLNSHFYRCKTTEKKNKIPLWKIFRCMICVLGCGSKIHIYYNCTYGIYMYNRYKYNIKLFIWLFPKQERTGMSRSPYSFDYFQRIEYCSYNGLLFILFLRVQTQSFALYVIAFIDWIF